MKNFLFLCCPPSKREKRAAVGVIIKETYTETRCMTIVGVQNKIHRYETVFRLLWAHMTEKRKLSERQTEAGDDGVCGSGRWRTSYLLVSKTRHRWDRILLYVCPVIYLSFEATNRLLVHPSILEIYLFKCIISIAASGGIIWAWKPLWKHTANRPMRCIKWSVRNEV